MISKKYLSSARKGFKPACPTISVPDGVLPSPTDAPSRGGLSIGSRDAVLCSQRLNLHFSSLCPRTKAISYTTTWDVYEVCGADSTRFVATCPSFAQGPGHRAVAESEHSRRQGTFAYAIPTRFMIVARSIESPDGLGDQTMAFCHSKQDE